MYGIQKSVMHLKRTRYKIPIPKLYEGANCVFETQNVTLLAIAHSSTEINYASVIPGSL